MVKKILILMLILLSPVMGWCVDGAPTTPHYGFYVRTGSGTPDSAFTKLKNFNGGSIPSYWKGAFVIIKWRDFEPADGVYDFAWLDSVYDTCAAEGKQMMLKFEVQEFGNKQGAGWPVIPYFMQTDSTYGDQKSCGYTTDSGDVVYPKYYGVYLDEQKGRYFPTIWDADLRSKVDDALTALGNHFNSKPYFEALSLGESAWAKPPSGTSCYSLSDAEILAYFKEAALAAKAAFPDKSVYLGFNFAGFDIEAAMDWCVDNDIGLTFPDVGLKDFGTPATIVNPYMKSHRNDIVTMAQIQGPDFKLWDYFHNSLSTPEHLLEFAIDEVDPWYIAIASWSEPYFSQPGDDLDALYPKYTDVKSVLEAVKDFDDNGGRLDHSYTPTDPVVSVSSTDTIASEDASNRTANFVLVCDDCTGESVEFTLSGSAHLTEDYTIDKTSPVTMSGSDVTITLTAVDDAVSEWTEGVTLTVVPGTGYEVGTPPAFQQITILDDDNAPVGLSIRMEKGGIEVDSSGRIIVN